MTLITNDQKICTLINVFTVEPEHQLALLEQLKEITENVMSTYPGYISANLHLSDDGKTVTNYAQWASFQDYQNVLQDTKALERMKHAAAFAIDFKPAVYTEIWTHKK